MGAATGKRKVGRGHGRRFWKERQEQTLRVQSRREQIDKVLAADTLTPEEKVYVIGILNAV